MSATLRETTVADDLVWDHLVRIQGRRGGPRPIAVGFGIKTPEQAAEVAKAADAAAVGTALVDRLAQNLAPTGRAKPGLVEAVLGDIAALAKGIRGARR